MSTDATRLPTVVAGAVATVPSPAQLPASEIVGAERYSISDATLYTFDGTTWTAVSGGGGGGGITQLTSDVTAGPGSGSQAATVVSVGGSSASNIHTAELAANAATNLNTASTIVKRDASGNFIAGTITAALTGTASGNPPNSRAINTTAPLTGGGNLSADRTLSIPVSTNSVDGYLSAADHTLFSSTSGAAITALTSDVSASGPGSASATVNSVGGSSAANIHSAELLANAATSLNTASAIVRRDASGNFTAGTITASLTGGASLDIPLTQKAANNGVATLDAGGKIPLSQLPASIFIYLGTWDASTNTPTLANGTGVSGDVYITSVAGTVDFGAGPITFAVSDWVIYNGSIWEKSVNSNAVASVNGQTGVVSLTTTNIPEGSNLYFTTARAQAASSATAPITYSGGVIAMPVSTNSVDGYLSAADHTTFAAKVSTTRAINTTAPLTGGGDLSADRTLSIPVATNSVDGYLSAADHTSFSATSGAAVTSLTGDVTGTGPGATATTVASVGGSSAANIHSAELAANAATAVNTPSTIVKRDVSGNFAAGTITAALTGTASGNPPNARLISTTSPLTGGGDLSADRTLSIPVATTSVNGYLSSTDWNTFNNKQAALTLGNLTDVGTDGITVTGGTGAVVGSGTSLSQHVADATHNGYLSSADWSTFNATSVAAVTSLTGDVTGTGPGATATTLASVGTAGTYVKVTTDAKGRVTSGSASPLGISDGGSGQTTANAALNAFLPSQTSNAGKVLETDGTNASWQPVASSNPSANIRASEGVGTTTLTNADVRIQVFNLTGNRIVKLPTTGVLAGDIWEINNASSNFNIVTIESSAGNIITTLQDATAVLTALVNTPTADTDWLIISPGQVLGVTDSLNNGGRPGYVGEFIQQNVQMQSSTGNGNAQDVCTITLTAGDWDVSGAIQVGRNGATFSTNAQLIGAILTVTGNSLAGGVAGDTLLAQETQTNFDRFSVTFGTIRIQSDGTDLLIDGISFTGTQVVNMKGYVNGYVAGTPYFDGSIRARRVR